ncbi:hypothetical protein [Mesorhizobium sp.]|uniref:hypothetical protein n=1 Tax=Mesorhizobium sp. TaxID=1871066 RepID=UPI000FE2FD12|nr:hypothetical protein [Mesorhizobium sp.]RWK36639.1 MAG: hypothetical protein EOR40_13440 [Mesorhizobium sp.]TIP18781.1 MAG: hypothetical protein E5X66_13535 [Mesorhizobium sp.]TJV83576.1 MAG: hypothetical protein E5X45_10640 [Mesorhizobium sp.]TJW16221.1 MAG: hypothetical protein E5X42_18535 [Mesorhizobium sp.]
MTRLPWKTPQEVRNRVLELAVSRTDPEVSVKEIIENAERNLANETQVFALCGAKDADRTQFEEIVKPLRRLISDSNLAVDRLMMEMIGSGSWIGFGRRHMDAGEEVIPNRYWPFLVLNIKEARAIGEGIEFRGVRFLTYGEIPHDHSVRDRIRAANKLPDRDREASKPAQKPVSPIKNGGRRGRKKVADWDAYYLAFKTKIAADGFPDELNDVGWNKQADVERWVTDLLEREGYSAANSTVRGHVVAFLERARSEIQN